MRYSRYEINEMRLSFEEYCLLVDSECLTGFDCIDTVKYNEHNEKYIILITDDEVIKLQKQIDKYCEGIIMEERLGFAIDQHELEIKQMLVNMYMDLGYLINDVDEEDYYEYDDDDDDFPF